MILSSRVSLRLVATHCSALIDLHCSEFPIAIYSDSARHCALTLALIVQSTIELTNFKLPIGFTIICYNISRIEDRSIKMSRQRNIESVKYPVRLGSLD